MRTWSCLTLAVLTACGRFRFEDGARVDGSTGDAVDGPSDGAAVEKRAYIKADNTETFDLFGNAVALSADGSTLVIGAPLEDAPGNSVQQSGAAYVYVRTGNTWALQAYLKPADVFTNDLFGAPLAISADGNTLAVGSPFEDSASTQININATDTSAPDAGAVYIFVRSGTTWSQQAYIKSSEAQASDQFGFAIGLSRSGDVLAVGAPNEDTGAMDVGSAYTFRRTGTTWMADAILRMPTPDASDNFGFALALSGDGSTLVVGAPAEDSGATTINGNQTDDSVTEAGAAYAYRWSGTTWGFEAYLKPPAVDVGDFFGRVLALSADGNTLASASMGEDSVQPNSGAVFLLHRSGTAWTQGATLKAPDAADNDQFGYSLAMTGDASTLLVGTPIAGATDQGAVYAVTTSVMRLPSPVLDDGDQYGNAVAIAADGLTRACARDHEDSAATGVDGDSTDNTAGDSGAVDVTFY